mgnify:CR=1 FL=1
MRPERGASNGHAKEELDRMADRLPMLARHHAELGGGLALAVGKLRIRARDLRTIAASGDCYRESTPTTELRSNDGHE